MTNTNLTTTTTNTIVSGLSDFVEIKDEEVFTTSRIVAEKFGKEHKNVIQAIENLIKTMTQVIENKGKLKNKLIRNPRDYFIEDEYTLEGQDRTYKQYFLTEKGAMLLTMGFTGEEAFMIKTQFIDEFNRMKNILNNPEQIIANTGDEEAFAAYMIHHQVMCNKYLKQMQEKKLLANKVHLLTHTTKTYTATELAKEMGFKSAIAFNKWLKDIKFQFKQNGTWVTYSHFSDNDYVSIKQEQLENGCIIYNRRFTDKGREYLLEKYKETH